jgi:hypothetical protein
MSRLMLNYASDSLSVKGNLGGFTGALGYKLEL